MVFGRPYHAQLRHPPLQGVDLSDAACVTTAWQVHLASFRHRLKLVAGAQRLRYPDQVVAYPPEIRAFRIDEVAFGFQLLLLRHADLGVLIPELAPYPWQHYPPQSYPEGRTEGGR